MERLLRILRNNRSRGRNCNNVNAGAIQFWLLCGQAQIALTVDGVTNDQQTVFGTVVPLAVSSAMVLTAIAYFTLKAPKRPFFPDMLWLHAYIAGINYI